MAGPADILDSSKGRRAAVRSASDSAIAVPSASDGDGAREAAAEAATRATLSVALLTRGYALAQWQAEALAALEAEGTIRVTQIHAVRDAGAGVERLCCRIQETIEYRASRADKVGNLRHDARAVFPRAAVRNAESTPASRVERERATAEPAFDLALNCGIESPLSRHVLGRLGVLECSFAGAASDIGLFRALVLDERNFRLSINLYTGQHSLPLGSAWPALPERPVLWEARCNVHRRAALMLAQALRGLAAGERAAAAPADEAAPLQPLDTRAACSYGVRRSMNALKRRLDRLRGAVPRGARDNWFLAYRTNPRHFVRNSESFRPDGFKLLLAPQGGFYADPCVIQHQGVDHVFLEEWRPELRRGVISWMRMDGDSLTPPQIVFERPYHLSYPFMVQSGNDIFMIPESASAKRVELYRAARFPHEWEPVDILLDNVCAVDATLCELDGRWWMFVNVGDSGSSRCDQLFLYYADRLGGPWRPHKRNPVKIDVRSSRPAGRLFERGGKLLRPSQDCSKRYGGALTLCEVQEISTSQYREVEVEKLLPGWLPFNAGFHTLSSSDRLEVIDGKILPEQTNKLALMQRLSIAAAPRLPAV